MGVWGYIILAASFLIFLIFLPPDSSGSPRYYYTITHADIKMWPPGRYPAFDEFEARAQMIDEYCGVLKGDIQLVRFDLIKSDGEIVGYDPESKAVLETKLCM